MTKKGRKAWRRILHPIRLCLIEKIIALSHDLHIRPSYPLATLDLFEILEGQSARLIILFPIQFQNSQILKLL